MAGTVLIEKNRRLESADLEKEDCVRKNEESCGNVHLTKQRKGLLILNQGEKLQVNVFMPVFC